MTVSLAITGCKKDDEIDGKGEGMLMIDGQEYSITDCVMRITWDNFLVFQNQNTGFNHLGIIMKSDELLSNTYQDDEITGFMLKGGVISFHYVNDFKMIVKKSGKTYDIATTGKAKVSEESQEFYDFILTYKGTVLVEKE